MDVSLRHYIKAARAKKHTDEQIKRDLLAAGWDQNAVSAGLIGEDLPVPEPPAASASKPPRPVVQTFSTRSFEYIIMFISLAVAALSLASLLHSNANALFGSADTTGESSISFAAAALIVSLPVFIVLFLRLKKFELSEPALRQDPSRKRAIQLTFVITFLIGLGNIIYFVYSLMAGSTDTTAYNVVGSQASTSMLGNAVHLAISLAIAGGIFAYYWLDEHRGQ
jgi:hypothetical protein